MTHRSWFGAACGIASGILLLLSCDMGPFGPLVLIAPAPLLFYALGSVRVWPVVLWSWVAGLLARGSLIAAYLDVFPTVVLVLWAIALPLWFAAIVVATRWIARRGTLWASLLAYPALAAGTEFLFSTVSPHGSFGALGYAITGFLPVLQIASLGGVPALTFVAAFVPMALVLLIRTPLRWRAVALLAGAPCLAVVIGGALRLSEDYDGTAHVALVAIDALQDDELNSEAQAGSNVAAYAGIAQELSGNRPDVILMPEKALIRKPGWADRGGMLQSVADRSGVPILAGWDETRPDGSHDNVAAYYAAGSAPQVYLKRRLIPELEADFNAGHDSLVIGAQGVAICKDLDFAPMIRDYGRRGVRLMLVPAWDFRSDTDLHARMALVRGVENGFAVARAAADGALSVSDAFGRAIAAVQTRADRPVTLVAEVGLRSGRTVYNRLGDLFGWLTVGLMILLIGRRVFR